MGGWKVKASLIKWKHKCFDDGKGNSHYGQHLQLYHKPSEIDELFLDFGKFVLEEKKAKLLKEIDKLIKKVNETHHFVDVEKELKKKVEDVFLPVSHPNKGVFADALTPQRGILK